jgi:hypothetical protein
MTNMIEAARKIREDLERAKNENKMRTKPEYRYILTIPNFSKAHNLPLDNEVGHRLLKPYIRLTNDRPVEFSLISVHYSRTHDLCTYELENDTNMDTIKQYLNNNGITEFSVQTVKNK